MMEGRVPDDLLEYSGVTVQLTRISSSQQVPKGSPSLPRLFPHEHTHHFCPHTALGFAKHAPRVLETHTPSRYLYVFLVFRTPGFPLTQARKRLRPTHLAAQIEGADIHDPRDPPML